MPSIILDCVAVVDTAVTPTIFRVCLSVSVSVSVSICLPPGRDVQKRFFTCHAESLLCPETQKDADPDADTEILIGKMPFSLSASYLTLTVVF